MVAKWLNDGFDENQPYAQDLIDCIKLVHISSRVVFSISRETLMKLRIVWQKNEHHLNGQFTVLADPPLKSLAC